MRRGRWPQMLGRRRPWWVVSGQAFVAGSTGRRWWRARDCLTAAPGFPGWQATRGGLSRLIARKVATRVLAASEGDRGRRATPRQLSPPRCPQNAMLTAPRGRPKPPPAPRRAPTSAVGSPRPRGHTPGVDGSDTNPAHHPQPARVVALITALLALLAGPASATIDARPVPHPRGTASRPLVLGVYPGGAAGTVGPAGQVRPEVPELRLQALQTLRDGARPFVVHLYDAYVGPAPTPTRCPRGSPSRSRSTQARGSRSSSCSPTGPSGREATSKDSRVSSVRGCASSLRTRA